jgi:hypothetical protein
MPHSQKRKKQGAQRTVQPHAAPRASTVERVADLAWAGQHAQAIELATTALGVARLSVGTRLDLLDLRAESLIALGKLDHAAEDAVTMLGLAKSAKTAAFTAQAQNRQSPTRASVTLSISRRDSRRTPRSRNARF